MQINFKNKKILLTGASGGIGKTLAEKFINNGAKLIITSSNEDKLDNLQNHYGSNHFYYLLDLSDTNKCAIHNSWVEKTTAWIYNWSIFCSLSNNLIDGVPETFVLHQNYPNPFNPITKISYELPKKSDVSISIYDVEGKYIKSFIINEQEAGHGSVYWNATNDFGQAVSAGMYIYTIQADEFKQARKMVLLKQVCSQKQDK